MEKIQERGLRFVTEDHESPTENILKQTNSKLLLVNRIQTIAKETFRIINKQTPDSLHNLLSLKQSFYNSRRGNQVYIPQVNSTRFDPKEAVSGSNQAKSSVQKGIRQSLLETYPHIASYLDQIVHKKGDLKIIKCHEHIEILANSSGEMLFFRQRDGPYMPALKLLHKYPFIAPHMQVDKGAIKFVLSGANIMCPGLTSPGARMTEVAENTIVAVMAEGKQHALAVGITKMSTQQILEKNKGIGLDNIHYLNDGLWNMKGVK